MKNEKAAQMHRIHQISMLKHFDRYHDMYYDVTYGIEGENAKRTKEELAHCVCGGELSANDIAPYLESLKEVVRKFRNAGQIDERFAICAEFIES